MAMNFRNNIIAADLPEQLQMSGIKILCVAAAGL